MKLPTSQMKNLKIKKNKTILIKIEKYNSSPPEYEKYTIQKKKYNIFLLRINKMSSSFNKPLTILYINSETVHDDEIDYKEKHVYYSGNKSPINDMYFIKGMKYIIICRYKKMYNVLGIGELESQAVERIKQLKIIPQWKIKYTVDNTEIIEFNKYLQTHLSDKKLQNKKRNYIVKDDIYKRFQDKYNLIPQITNKRLQGIVHMV
jgi:hypothetical protein